MNGRWDTMEVRLRLVLVEIIRKPPIFPEQITNYLIKEASYQAVVGPFKDNHFNDPIALSPLNSVPQKDSGERRVIDDLSFPEGESVYLGILKDEYLGNTISVSYPKVDDLIHLIKLKGPGCMIF